MRRKVLHLISDLDVAGAQTVVMNYLRKFYNDRDYEIHVAITGIYKNSPYEQECKENGYNLSYCGYTPWKGPRHIRGFINWIRLQRAIIKKIRQIKPDILHSHQTGIIPYVIYPFIISGIKTRFHTLHSDPYAIKRSLIPWARYAFNTLGIYPICVTKDQADKAVKRYRFKEYAIIPNGLDITKYQIKEDKDSIKRSINIPEDSFVIGCVARLDKIKNFDFFIEILAACKKYQPKAIAVIVGEGPEKNKIIELASKYGIVKDIYFLGLRLDVERIYKTFDTFLLTSFSESSSIVSVEAQLSGIKCVISDGVPSNIVITKRVNRISLNAPIDTWVNSILNDINFETVIYPKENFSICKSIESIKELYKKRCIK